MPLVIKDRVLETTNTTGTGTLTLAGAVAGYQSFAAVGNANTTYYTIVSGNDWEVGLGTYTSSGTTLSRDTVLASSAGGTTKITVAAGAQVFGTYPAEKSVYVDGAGAIAGYTITGGSINSTPIGASSANTGAFTTLSASSTVSGTGFSTYLSSPPPIGDVAPNTGTFTTIASTFNPTNADPAVHLTGTPNSSTAGRVGVLAIGPDFTAADKNIMASLVQDINDYTQIIVQNPNAGSTASADIVVNNNNTVGAGTYGDFGINSSNYSGTGSFSLPDATYLYSIGGELVLGTRSSNGIRFVVNDGSTDAGGFSSAGVFSLGTPLAITSGGTGKNTAPAAFNNLFGFSSTSTAGGTTTLTNASSVYQTFTGTQTQTVQLPATSTLAQGWSFHIVNSSTGVLTVITSTSVTLGTIAPGATVMATALTTSGNTAADWDYGYTDFSVDTRQVTQNIQAGNYTLNTTDYGKHIYHATGTAAATYTIPANSATPFEIGTAFTFVNMSANAVSIAITTDIMYLAGTGTTGTRTLAQFGMATALKMTATTWIISGSGLT